MHCASATTALSASLWTNEHILMTAKINHTEQDNINVHQKQVWPTFTGNSKDLTNEMNKYTFQNPVI